jgi:hypothetical protein
MEEKREERREKRAEGLAMSGEGRRGGADDDDLYNKYNRYIVFISFQISFRALPQPSAPQHLSRSQVRCDAMFAACAMYT